MQEWTRSVGLARWLTLVGSLLVFGQCVPAQMGICKAANGFASQAEIVHPTSIALDNGTGLYVTEGDTLTVYRIDLSTGAMSRIAGINKASESGNGKLAINAAVNPTGIAVNRNNDVFLAEVGSYIRRIDAATAKIDVFAGTGGLGGGGSGDGGPAIHAKFRFPVAIAVDSLGNIYVSDELDNRVRRIDRETMVITTVAGGGSGGIGDGGTATQATLKFPMGIAFNKNDDLYIADHGNNRIRRVDRKTGIISTVVGPDENIIGMPEMETGVSAIHPRSIAIDGDGNIYFNGPGGGTILRFDPTKRTLEVYAGTAKSGFGGDCGPARKARLTDPGGITAAPNGDLYFSDYANDRIRRIDAKTHIISTVFFSRVAVGTR